MRTPEYVIDKEYTIYSGIARDKVLPAGAFVKPIDPYWLPKHIKDSNEFKWANPKTEQFCYTHFGIVLIPLNLIRRVS